MSILYATADAALDVDESFLAGLGVHRITIPVPFLEAGGPVNSFAIEEEGGGFALFDCGIATDEGRTALHQGLSDHRLPLEQLKRIFVSHGHVDHYGNAQELAEKTGVKVHVHPLDREKVCGDGRWPRQVERSFDYFLALGVPEPVLRQMLEGAAKNRPYARQLDPERTVPLSDGQKLRFKHLELEVLHLPGHTPGLVCLWSQEHRLLFADDHVLARVSPNPLLDLTVGTGEQKFRALSSYMASAKKVYAMELDVVLPGHGPAFKNHRPLLDGLFAFYAKRQEKLYQAVKKKPSTVHELVHLLFPRVDAGRMYLMLSEVLGNLEVMEDQRLLRREQTDVIRFAPA